MTSHSVALVCQAGRVRWAKRSEEFKDWIRVREALDDRTIAADLFQGKGIQPGSHQVPADAWIERAPSDSTLLEESRLLPTYDAVLSLLWVREPLSNRDESDELLPPLEPDDFSMRRTRWPTKR